MNQELFLSIIGMAAICVYTYVLYQAFANHHKLCILLICAIVATQYVDYRHKQPDTLLRGFISGLYGESK